MSAWFEIEPFMIGGRIKGSYCDYLRPEGGIGPGVY